MNELDDAPAPPEVPAAGPRLRGGGPSAFSRRCLIVGASLAIIGAAGIARWSLLPIGGLLGVLGLLTRLITAEEHAHEAHLNAEIVEPEGEED